MATIRVPSHIVMTPSYSGKVDHGYGCVTVGGVSNAALARHKVLAAALQRAPNLPQLWLDDDILISPREVAELFAVQQMTGAQVVTGWYPPRIPHGQEDGGRPESLINNRVPGGYHGRWSEIATCAAGCMVVMPDVWGLFDEDEWLTLDENTFCPPAFISCPSWDRTATTEDYDFSVAIRRRGARIVSANRVSVVHHERRIPLADLQRLLSTEEKPVIDCVRTLSAATRSTADIVVIGDTAPSPEYLSRLATWCVDFGHPVVSHRFLYATDGQFEITTPHLARLRFFGAKSNRWAISYPDAQRIKTPDGSPFPTLPVAEPSTNFGNEERAYS